MELEFVPLLGIQRDIYRLPRGRERFEAYLHTMVDSRTGDLALPLVDMNPMGRSTCRRSSIDCWSWTPRR